MPDDADDFPEIPLARVLPGLPGSGPLPEQYPPSWYGHPAHCEGTVVEFYPESENSWVGNFQGGLTSHTEVVPWFGPDRVLVIACGQGLVIDLRTRQCAHVLGSFITGVMRPTIGELLILWSPVYVEAHTADGLKWSSGRLSWDGIEDVRVEGGFVDGRAWHYMDTWSEFRIDLQTGEATGGTYDGPEMTING